MATGRDIYDRQPSMAEPDLPLGTRRKEFESLGVASLRRGFIASVHAGAFTWSPKEITLVVRASMPNTSSACD